MFLAIASLLLQTDPAPACTAMDAALPPSLAAWAVRGSGNINDLTKPVVFASISPEDQAKLDTQKPGQVRTVADALAAIRNGPRTVATGGMTRVPLRIEKAGRYGIALDQPGWIDIAPIEGNPPGSVADGKPLASVQHGHGPACSTIRKIVRFDLQPGLYRLTLAKLTKPQAKVMLVTGE